MADAVRRELEEIAAEPDLCLAYAALLHLQRRCADDPSAMGALSAASPALLPRLLSDVHRPDEETAAQALKCLGFTLYHPNLVATISEGDAALILKSLVKLVTTTRMKAVCNLGVWCISVQQLSSKYIEPHAELLARVVAHALDNPFGSLSTTFEAMQAAVKLSQLSEKMKELSNVWVPPVYRRLISTDKRERDMAGRCFLKIKSNISSPPLILSQAITSDLKQNLLPGMIDMLQNKGQKVHIMKAWGCYIYLLGSHALCNRHLINEMLKIPEQMFSDPDPQVQIASLVAWESFIDALLPPPPLIIELEEKIAQECRMQKTEPTFLLSMRNSEDWVYSLVKKIKVIMMPLRGIISSRCDLSVRLMCLKTWHYLLYKLNFLVNHPSVLQISFESIIEVIFSRGPDGQRIGPWSLCLDMFDDFILAKVKIKEKGLTAEKLSCYTHCKLTSTRSFVNSGDSWMDYPIKWLPWELSSLNSHLRMIGNILSQESARTVNTENRILALNAALRIFRSVLQGIQVEWKVLSTPYDSIKYCIDTILKFTKDVCEDIVSAQNVHRCSNLSLTALQFVEAIRVELETSILESPLYPVRLDLEYIHNLQHSEDVDYPKLGNLGICFLTSTDMVTPMVYTTILHLYVVAKSDLNLSMGDDILHALETSTFRFFACNSSVNLHAFNCFLYMHMCEPVDGRLRWLTIWADIAKGLEENVDGVRDVLFSKTEYDGSACTMLYWFLCYPFLLCFPAKKVLVSSSSACLDFCPVSLLRELELEPVIEVWKSLFDTLNHASRTGSSVNNFGEGLCELLIKVLDENNSMLEMNIQSSLRRDSQNAVVFSILGEVIIHILKQNQVLDLVALGSTPTYQEANNNNTCSPILYSLGLSARFLGLSLAVVKIRPQDEHEIISRVFDAMATFVGRICLNQDVSSLMEIISDQLHQWLSSCATLYSEMQQGSTVRQLRGLWEQVLNCLQRSQVPVEHNFLFLEVQASLLQVALDHPDSAISDATVVFWRATYGRKANLCFPRCLLPALHKLFRSGKINVPMESPIDIKNNGSLVKEVTGVSKMHTEPILHKRNSEVNLMAEIDSADECVDILHTGLRRKRLKAARKLVAVKGTLEKGHSANNHSGTNFCTLFRYSVDKQDLRKPEYILEMLRRGK